MGTEVVGWEGVKKKTTVWVVEVKNWEVVVLDVDMKSPRLRTGEDDCILVAGIFSEGRVCSSGEQEWAMVEDRVEIHKNKSKISIKHIN